MAPKMPLRMFDPVTSPALRVLLDQIVEHIIPSVLTKYTGLRPIFTASGTRKLQPIARAAQLVANESVSTVKEMSSCSFIGSQTTVPIARTTKDMRA
jgi:hypothetical protein